jgi:hypothetical protein
MTLNIYIKAYIDSSQNTDSVWNLYLIYPPCTKNIKQILVFYHKNLKKRGWQKGGVKPYTLLKNYRDNKKNGSNALPYL